MAEKNLNAEGVPTACTRPRPGLLVRLGRELKRNNALYVLILVPLAVLILFKYVPMHGVQIAFRNYKPARGIYGSEWVGWKYFQKFFSSNQFWPLIRNTLSINLYSLATFPLALILALLLNYLPSKFFRKTVQMVSYAPHFISTVVMCGIIIDFFGRSGVVTRPNHVKVQAQDADGNAIELEAEEFFARAVCHELDHLDGVLYVDKMDREILEGDEEYEPVDGDEEEDGE